MSKDELINIAIKQIHAKSYLEIGHNEGQNFRKIEVASKESIDIHGEPTHKMSSDTFFSSILDDKKYDVIFIDGCHFKHQVLKDVNNSLKHINRNGIIFMHDCLPELEVHQNNDGIKEDAFFSGRDWTGDAWKVFFLLRKTNPNVFMVTVNADWGVGVILPDKTQQLVEDGEETFEYFLANKERIMNIISCEEYFEWIKTMPVME